MSPLRVKDLVHLLTSDADITRREDVAVLDGFVNTCVASSSDALRNTRLSGFSEIDIMNLSQVVEGLQHSHGSIRKLLRGEQSASAVDALAIARLQMEALYTFCLLLQSPDNIRQFMKNAWKKKYIRFLLGREDHRGLVRFDDYYSGSGLQMIENLQFASSVTDQERRTIDIQELGPPFGPTPTLVEIEQFPTPGKLIPKLSNSDQKRKRLVFPSGGPVLMA
jgi:hypothetical protein